MFAVVSQCSPVQMVMTANVHWRFLAQDHKTALQTSASSFAGSETQHRGISSRQKSSSSTPKKDRPQVEQQSKRSSDDRRV